MTKLLVSTICFISIMTGIAFAEPSQRHTLDVAPEISHITYKEPGVMQQEGTMYGITFSYAYRHNVMVRAEGRIGRGQVDYESYNTGTLQNIDDYVGEIRASVGYNFPVSRTTTVTPYIGIGYRLLVNDMAGMISSTGHSGYRRESRYQYSPIGVETITSLGNGWSLGATTEYKHFWKGEQTSYLSGVDPLFNDLVNKQRHGYGIRGSVKLQKKTEMLDFAIEPFVRYWHIQRSENADLTYSGDIISYGYEPRNHSTEFGVRLAVMF
jgi:hypothetical protein